MPVCQICFAVKDRLQPGALEGAGECSKPHCYFFPCCESCPECKDYLDRIRQQGRYSVVKKATVEYHSGFPSKIIPQDVYDDYFARAKVSTSTLSGTFFIGSIHTVTKGYICEDFAQEWLVEHGFPAIKKGAMLTKAAWDITIGEGRYDVKTNVVKVNPQPMYRCMVREDQLGNERITHFIGAYFKDPEMRLFLNGWIGKDEFLEKAERHYVGDVIDRGTQIVHDSRSVRIRELYRMEDLKW